MRTLPAPPRRSSCHQGQSLPGQGVLGLLGQQRGMGPEPSHWASSARPADGDRLSAWSTEVGGGSWYRGEVPRARAQKQATVTGPDTLLTLRLPSASSPWISPKHRPRSPAMLWKTPSEGTTLVITADKYLVSLGARLCTRREHNHISCCY